MTDVLTADEFLLYDLNNEKKHASNDDESGEESKLDSSSYSSSSSSSKTRIYPDKDNHEDNCDGTTVRGLEFEMTSAYDMYSRCRLDLEIWGNSLQEDK